jgi:hypothetical protein
MYCCENDHIFCKDEVAKPLPKNLFDEDNPDIDDILDEGIPEEYCPICAFTVYSEPILVEYCKHIYGNDYQEAFDDLKFKNKRRKKLKDSEYLLFVSNKYDLDIYSLFNNIKEKYKTYSELKRSYLR